MVRNKRESQRTSSANRKSQIANRNSPPSSTPPLSLAPKRPPPSSQKKPARKSSPMSVSAKSLSETTKASTSIFPISRLSKNAAHINSTPVNPKASTTSRGWRHGL